jgi:hypothetical protein
LTEHPCAGRWQDAEQLDVAQGAFGLTNTERDWIGALVEGRALWLMGSWRAVVQHHLAAAERVLVDTDQRMRAWRPRRTWVAARRPGAAARGEVRCHA